jgi:two-component system sensor kinase FixL
VVDRVQIQQVMSNLVRNALEAMTDSPRRDLTICTNALGRMLEVMVADTGPGIADRIHGELFHPFISTKPGGMGLGLSICRSIVEAHGGHIEHKPRKGGGSLFRFTLPTTADGDAAP